LTTKKLGWLSRGLIGLALLAFAVGAAPVASRLYKQLLADRRAELLRQELLKRIAHPDDSAVSALASESQAAEDLEQEDQLALREVANQAYFGPRDSDAIGQLIQAAEFEKTRWASRAPNPFAARAQPSGGAGTIEDIAGHSWINLGPTSANFQYNGARYQGNDSGRVADIAVDPRDPDVVYMAASAGGLWKTYDFFSADDEKPTWHPIFDTVANISIGALALDPSNPDAIYVALGDTFDFTAGGRVAKSVDGGGSWSVGPVLSGTYSADAGGRTETAVSGRGIAVDPTNSNRIFVTTEVGLFRSTDGGATFSLATLPTSSDGRVTVEVGAWAVAYLGSSGGNSHWLVSGVYACAVNVPPPRRFLAGGAIPGTSCPGGNPGDLWKSTDSGATWTSLRAAGIFDNPQIPSPGVGRIALTSRPGSTPAQSVVYAMASSMDERASINRTIAVLKSINGGTTLDVVATNSTLVSNPTSSTAGCLNMDVGHDQSWYNLVIAVNPENADQLIMGGNLCSVRSLTGGIATAEVPLPWDNVSHWLPTIGGGVPLPYVHADWHAIAVVKRDAEVWVLAGSDGGIFASFNVFAQPTPSNVVWSYRRNRGITSHQFYSIASGDPALFNPYVAFGGLQDSGTRFRELDEDQGGHPQPTTFNQVYGGDGVATAVVYVGDVEAAFWTSLPGGVRPYCRRSERRCNDGGDFPLGTPPGQWTRYTGVVAPSGDGQPFFVRYAALEGDRDGALLTNTSLNVYKINTLASGAPASPAFRLTSGSPSQWPTGITIRNLWASPKLYSDPGGSFRLYGVALSSGRFGIGVDSLDGSLPNWTLVPTRAGIGPNPDQQVSYTTAVAFPSSASNFAPGASDRDARVFLVGSTAARTTDEVHLVPDNIGHLFLTVDGGQTWQPFGISGANRLPNVPVQVVKFDPSDSTDRTLYVGTDIGVYRTTDRGANWERFGVGFPFARVTDLFISRNGSLLRVSTYGRGIWEIYPNADAPVGVKGDGDYDRNQQIDFRDVAALASRLGTTPASSAQPFYDWRSDLVGESNAIDEGDLRELLSKFGGRP